MKSNNDYYNEGKSTALESDEPIIQVDFRCKKQKQRLLIDALLKCSKIELDGIAAVLQVPVTFLINVYMGNSYLESKQSSDLAQLLFILLSDNCGIVIGK